MVRTSFFGKMGCYGCAECDPKGCRGRAESPLLASTRDNFAARNSPWWGLTRRLRRGRRACSPMGRSITSGGEPKVSKGERREARAQWAQPPKAVSDPEFRQTTSGAHGSAGRADCLPRGKPFGAPAGAIPCPQWGLTRRLRRGLGLAVPWGAHTFLSMAKEKCAKESQRHGDSGKKASTAHFDGGKRRAPSAHDSMRNLANSAARDIASPAAKMGSRSLFPGVAVPLAFFCTLFFRHRKKSVSAPWDGQSQSAPESARQAPTKGELLTAKVLPMMQCRGLSARPLHPFGSPPK